MEKIDLEKEASKPIKVESIKGPNQNEISLSPERGGIITSMVLKGKEVLYLDPDNFNNREQKVRGGNSYSLSKCRPLGE